MPAVFRDAQGNVTGTEGGTPLSQWVAPLQQYAGATMGGGASGLAGKALTASGAKPWSWGSKFSGLLGGPAQTFVQTAQNAQGAANTLGSQQAAAAQAAAQQNAANAAAQQQSQQAQQDAESKELLRQLTARRLMMLRQQAGGQQNRNIAMLRRHLAQRGALDSGSLGAGVTSIGNETSGLLAQGTNLAANQEAEALLDLLKGSRAMQFSREQQSKQNDFEEYMARVKADLERRNRPSGIEQFLAALGGVGGSIAGRAGGKAVDNWME